MDKKKVVAEIQNYLAQELSDLAQRLEEGGASKSGPANLSNATSASEASEAAQEIASRVEEIKRQLLMYKFLPLRPFTSDDVICPGGLVELQLNQMHAFYLIVPNGGGLVTRVDGQAVQVITPNSPLGEVLMGKKVGDHAQVQVAGKTRDYKVVGYF